MGKEIKKVDKKSNFLAFLLGVIISFKVLPLIMHIIYGLIIIGLSIAVFMK